MFKKIILFCFTSLLGVASWCNPSSAPLKNIDVVYRLDNRGPEEIRRVGGMWPRAIEGRVKNDFLINHFSGLSVKKGTSNFVSTTTKVGEAVDFFSALGKPQAWIYMVRPTSNFYNMKASLEAARDSAQDENDKCLLKVITHLFATMEEYVAHGGFSNDRIIGYAPITTELVKNTSREKILKTSFWINRFEKNPAYNSLYNNDVASTQVYKNVGQPPNYVLKLKDVVQKVFKTKIPLAYSCLGISTKNTKQELRSINNGCEGSIEIESIPYYENWSNAIKLETLLSD